MAQSDRDEPHPYESTTQWVQEVARRSASRATPAASGVVAAHSPRDGRRFFGVRREIYLLAALAAAYANFYFMRVLLEINSLPSLVVFVAVQPLVG